MITWTFTNQKNRSLNWYVVAIIIMLTLLTYAIFTGLYLMAIVVVLFTGVYLYIENNSEEFTTVVIDEKQILIGTSQYFLENFESFTIVTAQGQSIFLRFFSKKKLAPTLDIPFSEETDLETLREFLGQILAENSNSEISQIDALIYASRI